MVNPFEGRIQLFNYLKHRYAFLSRYLSLLQQNDSTCDSMLNDKHGPFQFLNTCSNMLFFKENFDCDWEESTISKHVYKYLNKSTQKLDMNDTMCVNLFTLGKAFADGVCYQRKNDRSKYKPVLLKPQQPLWCSNFYMFDDVVKLKCQVQQHLMKLSTKKLHNYLQIYDGCTLIPEYLDLIIPENENMSEIPLDQCVNSWCIYGLILAAECMRTIAVLMYPYIWQSNNSNSLTWDDSNIGFQHKIQQLESVCLELMQLAKTSSITVEGKKRILSMVAIMKDSTIRLGLGIKILYPLNENKQPISQFMKNKYLELSEVYSICTYINTHKLDESPEKLNKTFWTSMSLLKMKNNTNCICHDAFHVMTQERNGYSFENKKNLDFDSNLKKLQDFISELNGPEPKWMLN